MKTNPASLHQTQSDSERTTRGVAAALSTVLRSAGGAAHARFFSLLRKTTLESAKHLRRVEFGAVVGSGRAPCVKTLRRKLHEFGGLSNSIAFGSELARRWIEGALVATAVLYVDGHRR